MSPWAGMRPAAGLGYIVVLGQAERFLSPQGDFDAYLDLDHLKVFVARPAYLLAMKCAAMRLGEEFQDLADVRFLLNHLNITRVEDALNVVTRYFDAERLPPKTRLALEELLPG